MTRTNSPSAVQIRTVPSLLAEANRSPLLDQATAFTSCVWPLKVFRGTPTEDQMRTVPS